MTGTSRFANGRAPRANRSPYHQKLKLEPLQSMIVYLVEQRAGGEEPCHLDLHVNHYQRNPSESSSNTSAELRKEVQYLRDDNERLKELVIQLTVSMINRVFTDLGPKGSQVHPEHVLATAEACFSLARLPNVRPKLAAAFETVGNELSARAVDLDTDRERRRSKTS